MVPYLLSIFEVCFEGVTETFGVFHKLLFLVFQGLAEQKIKQKHQFEMRGKCETIQVVGIVAYSLLTLRFWY